ncbi:hypothetical protein [Paenibacillus sp. 8b26]|uniref:hypothetical protein n=1 Tax=Paenibacillus sp. 8b26 TaxID=3424133 RepID=UPI003D65938F
MIAQATGVVLMVGFMKLAAVHMVDLVRYLFREVAQVTGFANADEVNTTDRLQVGESHRAPLEITCGKRYSSDAVCLGDVGRIL